MSNSIITIGIKPISPLVFKDIRPFTIGGQAFTEIIPRPSTIAGMIKTALMEELGFSSITEALEKGQIYLGRFKTCMTRNGY